MGQRRACAPRHDRARRTHPREPAALKEEPVNSARPTPTPASSNPVNQNYDPDAPPSQRFAVGAILVTAVLLLAMLGLLLYRSLTQSAPSAVLIVQGDPHWDGTRLLVSGQGAGSRPTRLAGVLDRSNKYSVTFFLAPGQYELRVMTDVSELSRLPIDLSDETHRQLGVDLRHSRIPPPHPTTDESKD